MKKIRIIITDDHPAFREGLSQLLNREDDLEVVAVAAESQETVKLVKELKPDVAILDVAMPHGSGVDTARQIKEMFPKVAILMISAYKYDSYILSSLQAGASGYVLKSSPVEELIGAIRLVHEGEGVFDLKDTGNILHRLAVGEKGAQTKRLGERELRLLCLVGKGMTNKGISSELVISERTVQTHLVNIFRKLAVSSRTEAVLYCLKQGWISLDDVT